jgi:hypothetical protein
MVWYSSYVAAFEKVEDCSSKKKGFEDLNNFILDFAS